MSINTNRLPGHELLGGERPGPAPARCACGAHSLTKLPSHRGRKVWLRWHKEEVRAQMREAVVESTQPFPYMTLVPLRTPRNKPHESLGQAKKAVLFRLDTEETLKTDCRVYQWAGNQWKLLWEIKQGTHRKEMPWLPQRSPKV